MSRKEVATMVRKDKRSAEFDTNAIYLLTYMFLPRPDQIILHGWSIGGFTASCLAMNYPDVKGVVIITNLTVPARRN